MKKILVTGANGQLGQCFKKLSGTYPNLDFHFATSKQLDITSKPEIEKLFKTEDFDYCINCAAYTKVDKAEIEKDIAFKINSLAVENLAKVCLDFQTVLIHFSTDYVFDGTATKPYKEADAVEPINVYGASKLAGEEMIMSKLDQYYIFRTSWLYSEFGHNFFKTILKKAEEKKDLKIITSQLGTPTNANDLAESILNIISSEQKKYGLYHFSNEGEATWYDFATEILNLSGRASAVKLEKIKSYPTPAKRPDYSVLSKEKMKTAFNIEILDWMESLKKLIGKIS